jgi:hypothetical protein
LIDWLRVALTRADADQPSRLCVEYPSQPTLQQPSDMNLLTAHRLALVKRDLPTLSPDVVHQGSQHIASSLGHLVAEHNSEFVPPAPPVRPPSVFNVRFHRQP